MYINVCLLTCRFHVLHEGIFFRGIIKFFSIIYIIYIDSSLKPKL